MTTELYCGIVNYPRPSGSGRFPGYDDRFDGTNMLGVYAPSHMFRELFLPPTLDAMLPVKGEPLRATIDRWLELEDLIAEHANRILDHWSSHYGLAKPPDRLRIIIDLESALLGGRDPYVDSTYGVPCICMMNMLCNRVEFFGLERGWDVLAAPYHAIKSTGYVWSRPERMHLPMPAEYAQKHGGDRVKPLLDRRLVDIHAYCSMNPDKLAGATHEGFAWRQIENAAAQLKAAGVWPEEVLCTFWAYGGLPAEPMRNLFVGAERGLSEFFGGIKTGVVVFGDWNILAGLVDSEVRQTSPGQWTIDPDLACEALATAWKTSVVEPFREVFDGQVSA